MNLQLGWVLGTYHANGWLYQQVEASLTLWMEPLVAPN
jgi:hypothetical protein